MNNDDIDDAKDIAADFLAAYNSPIMLELPEILNIPPKLYPLITDFNDYKYFVIEGGRGSSKTQTVARLLLYIAEKRKARMFCGREVQNTIEESVYTVLADLISGYKLAFDVKKTAGIRHLITDSEFKFKGFREQGAVNIKGVEGADIIWVDEAQSMTKPTLDVLIPTVRKNNSKIIFTMNRYLRSDAVMDLVGRPDCLHIKINYFENPFCPLTLKHEAELVKNKSERDYRHIWLGEPLAQADDYLFNYDKLHAAFKIEPFGESIVGRQRVMGIDFAAQGNDNCVATILDRVSNVHWKRAERISWSEPDAMVSTGKIVALIGQHKPDVNILDVGGMGHVVYNRLLEVGMKVERFDGATTQGVDVIHYANARANGYYTLKDWLDNGWLCLDENDQEVVSQLEKIKMKYRSDGRRILESKVDMKKEMGYSPDDADSLMMAVWGAVKHLGRSATSSAPIAPIKRISGSKRRKA